MIAMKRHKRGAAGFSGNTFCTSCSFSWPFTSGARGQGILGLFFVRALHWLKESDFEVVATTGEKEGPRAEAGERRHSPRRRGDTENDWA